MRSPITPPSFLSCVSTIRNISGTGRFDPSGRQRYHAGSDDVEQWQARSSGCLGAVIYRGGNEDQARDFIEQLYRHVPVLGYGTRDSTTTFVLEEVGDVFLTSENEALREVKK